MSCMKNLVLSEPTVDIVDPNTILTSSFVIKVGTFIPCNSVFGCTKANSAIHRIVIFSNFLNLFSNWW